MRPKRVKKAETALFAAQCHKNNVTRSAEAYLPARRSKAVGGYHRNILVCVVEPREETVAVAKLQQFSVTEGATSVERRIAAFESVADLIQELND